jgi:hypothetical protein
VGFFWGVFPLFGTFLSSGPTYIYFFLLNQEYRERVCSALAKYHSTGKKPRIRPSYAVQPAKKKKPVRKRDSDTSILVKSASKILKPIQPRQRKSPAYKDPLVNSKLEMIKNIRAQRASVDTRQTQSIQQAR